MLTFTQRKNMAAKLCGINYTEPEMDIIETNLNMGDKLLENAARRMWTRKEKVAKLTAGKQFYQIASDMHRVISIKCRIATDSDIIVPLSEVQSEDEWNKLNAFPFSTSYPTHYFIKGDDEIGIYPCPSEDVVEGLMVSYSPRIRDMGIDDFNFTADVVQNGVNITNPDSTGLPGGFQEYMTENFWIRSTDGQDGNWYKVQLSDAGQTGYVYAKLVETVKHEGTMVTTGNVNMRSGPGTDYAKRTVIAKNTLVTVLSTHGDFARVNANGWIGYISLSYLK